jgi:hypothetical protein
MANSMVSEKERYFDGPLRNTAAVFCQRVNCKGTNLCLIYAKKKEIFKPFKVSISVSSPWVKPAEYNHHNPRGSVMIHFIEVDLSPQTSITFESPVQIALNPAELNFIMQSIQLNLNYTDEKDEYFQFIGAKQSKRSQSIGGLAFSSSIMCPEAQLELINTNNEKLLNIKAKGIDIGVRNFSNKSTQSRISITELLMHDKDINNKEVPMAYTTQLKDRNNTENFIITMEYKPSNEQVLEENKTIITINNQMLVLRINTLFSIVHMINIAMPNYEQLHNKPNKCKLIINYRPNKGSNYRV